MRNLNWFIKWHQCLLERGQVFGSTFQQLKILSLPYVHQLCSKKVLRGGDNNKSYTTNNIVHHLKSKHPEKHKKYEELKAVKEKQNRDEHVQCTEISSGDEAKLKQVTLTEAKELQLPWDINDDHAKFIHIRITEMSDT